MATRPFPPVPVPTIRTIREETPTKTWATVSEAVASGRDEVILESEGLPAVAVISLTEYARWRKARDQERRDAALHWLREFQDSYDGRNDDLPEDEVDAIATAITQEAIDRMAEKGIVRFDDDHDR